MIKINIDGKEFQVDPKNTIIEAAALNGIEIPHFCWHPKLSVTGNCRMCLVEVEKMPKLVIACATQVADGMVVKTRSEKVVKARNAVMEFLLINHPLDCPICDEAGECKLQDYTYKYSTGVSRFREDKVHKPKRIELGPNVMLDDERCIMCSRCIRFSEEIAGQKVLTFTERGTHVVLRTFPGTQLDNPYSMNVIEICPVGALTSKNFRFKSRVWEMSSTESICISCARGCNANVWVRNNEVLRLTPRINPEVNDMWMCDEGRLKSVEQAKEGKALNGCLQRKEGVQVEVDWDEELARLISDLRTYKKNEIAGIASPYAANEDNYIFLRLMRDIIGTKNIFFLSHAGDGKDDDLLIRADKTPNQNGARLIGLQSGDENENRENLIANIAKRSIKVLYVMEDDIALDPKLLKVLPHLELLVVHSAEHTRTTDLADHVLSVSGAMEKHGTMINFQKRIQRLRPALVTIEQERSQENLSISRWDAFAAPNDRWGKGPRRDARPSWRVLQSVANGFGGKMKFTSAEDVFKEMAEKIPAFRGLNYLKIGSKGVALKQ
ncbi:MAG: 2Fe-2S iron-sulfur cluster-binding protein [Bacteroidota bacterium]